VKEYSLFSACGARVARQLDEHRVATEEIAGSEKKEKRKRADKLLPPVVVADARNTRLVPEIVGRRVKHSPHYPSPVGEPSD
jgi:hypothetical protein